MPRPARKQEFLVGAQRLVQARGFASTSLDAVCEDIGTTKEAFFHYFHDKDELGLELLKYFRESGRAALSAGERAGERDPRRRLRRYLAHLESVYAAAIGEWLDAAGAELKAIFSMMPAHPAMRPRDLAELLLANVEGALILNRTTGGAAR